MGDISLLKKIYDSKSRSSTSHILKDEELALIKNQSYEQGVHDGKVAQKKEIDEQAAQQQKELETSLILAMNQCSQNTSENLEELYNLVIKLGVSLFQKTFKASCSQLAEEEVKTFISEHVQTIKAFSKLNVRVHSSQLKFVKQLCATISKKAENNIEITVADDEALQPTDAIISWEKGSVERTLQSLLDSVDDLKFTLTASIDNEERTHHG